MRIAVTGHRPNKLGYDYALQSELISKIKTKLSDIVDLYGKPTMISGMALGIDTLFALIALEKQCPLIAAIPCVGQEIMWAESSQNLYHKILASPNVQKVLVTQGPYSPSCMQLRNKWMVDNADLLIAVWDGTPGGTANCVEYARERRLFIITINPKEL